MVILACCDHSTQFFWMPFASTIRIEEQTPLFGVCTPHLRVAQVFPREHLIGTEQVPAASHSTRHPHEHTHHIHISLLHTCLFETQHTYLWSHFQHKLLRLSLLEGIKLPHTCVH